MDGNYTATRLKYVLNKTYIFINICAFLMERYKQAHCMSHSQVIKINPICCNHELYLNSQRIKSQPQNLEGAFKAIHQLMPHGGCLMENNFPT